MRHRSLESYLLSDELIRLLCQQAGFPERVEDSLQLKATTIASRHANDGKAVDDVKSSAGMIYVELKRTLSLSQAGNTIDAFLANTMAPLMTPDTHTYRELRDDIFPALQ